MSAMSDSPRRRCTQREIREGKAPRRLAERGMTTPTHANSAGTGAGAYLTRHAHLSKQWALALAVMVLVIASTIVHG
jgi:hypothetical protein